MNNAHLIQKYTPLVNQIAGGFQRKLPRNVLREDIVAAGMVGLWSAIQKHDQNLEGFDWYVRIKIRGAILDELRAQDWLPRRARQAALKSEGTDAYVPPPAVVRFDDVSEWEQNKCLASASSSEAIVNSKMAQENIFAALDTLPERERFIVSQHYFAGVKFKDLAETLKVSDARISQLHKQAMDRLRNVASLNAQ